MCTIAQSLTENPPPEGLSADSNDLTAISQSCKTYQQLWSNVKVVEKVITVRSLNKRGFTKITYRVGDRVTFFLSPSQKQTQTLEKNPKHMLQYAGPGFITRSLSDKGTSWEISWNDHNHQSNVIHIHHYRPDQHVFYEQTTVHDNIIMVGSYVTVFDTDGDAN